MWPQQRLFSRYFCSFCAISFIIVLIYDRYQPYVDLYSLLVNNSIALEKSLQDIPICSSDDRTRQRSLLYTLQAWTYFARQNRIQYWIAYGTLLGYVRNHSLLPHDTNLDVFVMGEHMSQLQSLSRTNFSFDYKLLVHPQWSIVDQKQRSYFLSDGIDFRAPNARFIHRKDNVYLNIWPIYNYHPNRTKPVFNDGSLLTSYDINYQWTSTPTDFTFPLRICDINSVKVWCPAEPEQLVMDMYGPTSMTTPLMICVNETWTRADKPNPTLEKVTQTSKSTTTTTEETTDESTSTVTYTSSTSTRQQSTTLSDHDLIEKALEQIPTCTSDDRNHQRILLNLLQAWSHLAEKHNIEYWLLYGSLVGYVQRQGLLPHDGDVDIVANDEQILKLINISQTNFSSNYEIKIQPQWQIVGEENRVYFRDQGINFIQPNARFIHKKSRNHIDIFPIYDFNPATSNRSTEEGHQSENVTIYDNAEQWLSIPRKWVYPVEICYFSGIQTRCPAEPKKLVSTLYGVSALSKSNKKCENGSWVNA